MGFGPWVDLFTHGINGCIGGFFTNSSLNPLGCGWVINRYKDIQCVHLTKNEKYLIFFSLD
jgi:hypothetical protein